MNVSPGGALCDSFAMTCSFCLARRIAMDQSFVDMSVIA
jgi:hypothetical protein